MTIQELPENIREQLLYWATKQSHAICLEDAISGDLLLGVGVQKFFTDLNDIPEKEWIFGYISYDYKNNIEDLVSENTETISFDTLRFFIPETVIAIKGGNFTILRSILSEESLLYELSKTTISKGNITPTKYKEITPHLSKEDYIKKGKSLQEHIRKGDIYEVNFCQEFTQNNIEIEPVATYSRLLQKSPMPFGCFLKDENKFALCASPERYIKKINNKISSQPIKGTAPRGKNSMEDKKIIYELENNEKERAENIMAVDVVRNDFARIAIPTSVKVDELCKVYTFKQLHQMISTVSAKISKSVSFKDIVHGTFPMASMTGAPKIRAMQLIEKYENSRRGLYSGTIGYISPEGNFDFNVVIRTLLYNQDTKQTSFTVGSAITAKAEIEKEYDECLLKANAITQILRNK